MSSVCRTFAVDSTLVSSVIIIQLYVICQHHRTLDEIINMYSSTKVQLEILLFKSGSDQ